MMNEENMIWGIVIVTYNRLQLLKECLEALRNQQRPYDRIIVIDNASTDGTMDFLDKQDDIICVHMNENMGGAGGFEKGLRVAVQQGCDWITLIDDDAILDRLYLEQLISCKTQLPSVKALCGAVYNQNKIMLGFARRILLENGRIYEWCVPADEYKKQYFHCDIASFCGLTISREMIGRIGYPDGRFFICFDDTEYSMRIDEKEGIVLVTGAKIDHRVAFAKSGADWKRYYNTRNDIYRIRKHYGILRALSYSQKFIYIYNSFMKDIPYTKRQKKMIRAAIIDGLMGRLGRSSKYGPKPA